MASKKITVADLDFDNIKSNLKTFLQGQSTFQDYDFEGSGLSVLLDILAYNTHYNALYSNLSINEMFLDSARKRNSVVSIAKELGYRPKSATCASATVNVTFTSPTAIQFSIPIGTPFTSTVNGVNYVFYTTSAYVSPASQTSYTFTNVKIVEKATSLTKSYTAATGSQYILPNANADLSTVVVKVGGVTYNLADVILNVDNTSLVYWIKEIDNGLYELIFGDGVIGKAIDNGSSILITYDISSGIGPNGAQSFNYAGATPTNGTASVAVASKASGGTFPEDIDSIRFNAPRYYSSQNRCVTPNDYKVLIAQYLNTTADAVSAWGGEDNIPPVYGKVFICAKPPTSDLLTEDQKSDIINNLLQYKKVSTMTPVIVDPEYIDIIVNSTVYYNNLLTSRTSDTLKALVLDTISTYNTAELQKFDSVFRYSKLSKLIDESESSIINNNTRVTFKIEVKPKFNITAQYLITLGNPIYYSGVPEDMILSTGFYISGDNSNVYYLTDDGNSNIQLFYINSNDGARVITNSKIGTVNYKTGVISIKNLNITSIVGSVLYFYIKPESNDIVSFMTKIARISMNDLVVNIIDDKSSSGDLRAGTNYVFTPSRI